MRKRMNKTKFLSLRGATLIGLGLLVVGLTALLVLSPDFVLGQEKGKGGKPNKPPGKGKPGLYRVYLYPHGTVDTIATDTSCNGHGYVLADWDDAHNFLRANGTMIDGVRIPLFMQLFTKVEWTRKYPEGYPPEELQGVFDGCYGETDGDNGYHGALFITLGKKKRQSIIRFTWYFDYYTAPDVREHFALFSEDIPFQKWTGEDITKKQVEGWFDLQYYLNDPDNRPSYESFTGGVGRTFNFLLTIEKITQ